VSSTAATDPCTSCRRSARAISACSCGFIPSATTIWYQIRRAEMLTGRVVPDGPHRRQGRPQDGHGRHPAADGYLHVPDQLPAHLQLSIGIWAPILLVLLRILQGLSASGEQAGANSMSFEHAPDQRRGYYTSWTLSGTVGGQVIAPAVVLPLSAAAHRRTTPDLGMANPVPAQRDRRMGRRLHLRRGHLPDLRHLRRARAGNQQDAHGRPRQKAGRPGWRHRLTASRGTWPTRKVHHNEPPRGSVAASTNQKGMNT
jgi:hypothetical protein